MSEIQKLQSEIRSLKIRLGVTKKYKTKYLEILETYQNIHSSLDELQDYLSDKKEEIYNLSEQAKKAFKDAARFHTSKKEKGKSSRK